MRCLPDWWPARDSTTPGDRLGAFPETVRARAPPRGPLLTAPRPMSGQDPERVAESLGTLPRISSEHAAARITPEVPMPDQHTPTRTSSFAHLPRSAGLALILALVLFAGGYAAGQEVQPAPSLGPRPLELLAVPLAGGVGLVTPEQVLAVDLS